MSKLQMGDAVPQTLWDFSLSAGLTDFSLAKFRTLRRMEMLVRSIELSRNGTRAPTQVRTGGRETASHVIRSFVDRPRFFVQPIGSTSRFFFGRTLQRPQMLE